MTESNDLLLLRPVEMSHQTNTLSNVFNNRNSILDVVECLKRMSSLSEAWSLLRSLKFIAASYSITETVGYDNASATKFVSPFTNRISVVNSAMKAKCLVWRRMVVLL